MQTCARGGLKSGNSQGQRGPRRDPLCPWEARLGGPPAVGASRGRGRRNCSPKAGPMGQAGQRTCRRGTQVSNGAPCPAASPAAQPTRPRRRISEGPDSLRLRLRQSPSPDRRSGPEVAVPVRNVGQRLPLARAQPREQPPPSRSEGDKGPGWALLYLRNQREQRLLHRARFDL